VAVTGHETPSRCGLLPWRHTVKCDGSGSRRVKTPRQGRCSGHLRLVTVRTNGPGNLARRRTPFVTQRVIGPSACFGRVRHNGPRASVAVRPLDPEAPRNSMAAEDTLEIVLFSGATNCTGSCGSRQDQQRRFRVGQRALPCARLPITVLWLDGSGREPSRSFHDVLLPRLVLGCKRTVPRPVGRGASGPYRHRLRDSGAVDICRFSY
jgi:hypothetical protein